MAVAFAILTFVFHRLEGVKFEEGFLRVSAQADDPAATVYAGKIQGERVKITVTDCPDEQRTAVEVQVGDRVRDECVVETGLTDAPRLLLIRDSYSDSLTPFLTQSFSQIHLFDPRYNLSSIQGYIQDNGIDAVAVLYSIPIYIADEYQFVLSR